MGMWDCMTLETPAVAFVGIDKRFGAVHANRDISLTLAKGSIHGLIGENGAGKSTLANILYGYLSPDRGEIRIDGQPRRFSNPSEAIAAGIGMVHQHFMLVETFTVLENLILGDGSRSLREAKASALATLARLAKDHDLGVDPEAVVATLPVGLRQRVEIIKALHRGAQILILDEPTAVLTPAEAEGLFTLLRALKAEGRTVLLVTHKLKEIMAITDHVTVLRQGAVVGTVETRSSSPAELAELMIGRKPSPPRRELSAPGGAVLEVRNLRVTGGDGRTLLRDASLSVHAGEIVGIAGVAGNGQSELLGALAGLLRPGGGKVALLGQDITRLDGRERRGLGIGHIPEDRLRDGMIADMSATETGLLGRQHEPRFNRPLLLRRGFVLETVTGWMRDYDIRPPDPGRASASFSGGNQQKLVCAREMERKPALLLVGQPTRGVDIGAIEFIHDRLLRLRDAGAAILLVSVELDEIRALSDRILVMAGGSIVGELSPQEASDRTLGLLMAGMEAKPGTEAA